MRIVIAGGNQEADYIIGEFNKPKNPISVINPDMNVCKYLSKNNHINVICGKINKEFDLGCAQINDADLFIALSDDDVKNYIACKMAKIMFNVKKTIASVRNPKNVTVFKELGIDSVISSTYLLGETIKSELSIENMINTLAFEDNKILVSEFEIKKNYKIIGKSLKDITFPKNTSVACIYRSTGMIIPNGETIIELGDKVLMVSSANDQKKVQEFICKR